MTPRRVERESLAYIDCEVPEGLTLREWRCGQPADARPNRLRAAAAAVGRAARLRKRS
jgi:hypothetical protein